MDKKKKNIISRFFSTLDTFIEETMPRFFSNFFWIVGNIFSALIVMLLIFAFCVLTINYILG